jgi:hypothetical protein
VYALPKRAKTRDVPLSRGLLRRLDEHMKRYPPVSVTLPWRDPAGDPVSVELLLTTRGPGPLHRRHFNLRVWHVARKAAGILTPTRDDGMHALRHHYASVLLDAGESIKALSEYLGHTDPGFTLRTYTHLMPSSAERTRKAIDNVWVQATTRTRRRTAWRRPDDGPAHRNARSTAVSEQNPAYKPTRPPIPPVAGGDGPDPCTGGSSVLTRACLPSRRDHPGDP